MTRIGSVAVVVAMLTVASAKSAHAQAAEARFTVSSVGDSTLTFPTGGKKWVAVGRKGIVVDPKRSDVLVARFAVISVSGGMATALITGQTTTVTSGTAAVMEIPETKTYHKGEFWLGTLLGGVAGFLIGHH